MYKFQEYSEKDRDQIRVCLSEIENYCRTNIIPKLSGDEELEVQAEYGSEKVILTVKQTGEIRMQAGQRQMVFAEGSEDDSSYLSFQLVYTRPEHAIPLLRCWLTLKDLMLADLNEKSAEIDFLQNFEV